MKDTVRSGGLYLAAHLARPLASAAARRLPALVLAHGFPAPPVGAPAAGRGYPELADRLAAEVGWVVLAFNFRGAGDSPGNFSLRGWLDDLRAVVAHLRSIDDVSGVWLAGSSTGGALSLVLAAEDPEIRGVTAMATPADFDDWSADSRAFLDHCRQLGVIKDPSFPPDVSAWAREVREIRPLAAAAKVPPRPLLIMQGDADPVVSTWDARALVDAAGGGAELRVIPGAGHRLRHDPRAVAILVGWLERQQP